MENPKSEPDKVNEYPNMINADDLVVAIKRSPEGLMIMIKPKSRGELIQAYGELQIAITQEVIRLNEMRHTILKPEHKGILNFARERFRK